MKILSQILFALALAWISFNSNGADFNVSNVGMTAYSINGVNNPTLTLQRGSNYVFAVSAVGHPFDIKTNSTTGSGDRYNNGVTGQGATSGNLTFTVPLNAPAKLFYHCEIHSTMVGTIIIVPPVAAVLTNVIEQTNKFIFTINAVENQTNLIQATTNLAGAANWTTLSTNVPVTSSSTFTDLNTAPFSNRFYRVIAP